MGSQGKLISYFVHHPVAANLLMLFIVLYGAIELSRDPTTNLSGI